MRYNNFKNKLLELNTTNSDLATKFVAFLKRDEGVFKIFDKKPDFLDNINDVNKARRVAKIGGIFAGVVKKVEKEPFRMVGNKWKGFSFNKWNEQPNRSWLDSGSRLHSDQDIYEMIDKGLDLNPKIPDLWVEDIVTKAFRGTKTKTKKEIIGDVNAAQGADSQEFLGELGVASQLGNRVPPPNGLPWCFPDYNAFLNFKQVIKRRLLERYGVDDIVTDIHISGSVHTKKTPPPSTNVGPPDIDVVIYLSRDQIKAIYQRRIDHIYRCLELNAINPKNGNPFFYNRKNADDVIKEMKDNIALVDSPNFDINKSIGPQNFRTIETNANGISEVKDLKDILRKNRDNQLNTMLQNLNLTKNKMDLKIFPIEAKSTELRPISQVTL